MVATALFTNALELSKVTLAHTAQLPQHMGVCLRAGAPWKSQSGTDLTIRRCFCGERNRSQLKTCAENSTNNNEYEKKNILESKKKRKDFRYVDERVNYLCLKLLIEEHSIYMRKTKS